MQTQAQAKEKRKHHLRHHSVEIQECIDRCLDCHQICLTTMFHCLDKGEQHSDPLHIAIMQDCIDICSLAANAMLRGSKHHRRICKLCSEICKLCAEDCRRISTSDEIMNECVTACQRCSESCDHMVNLH